MIHIMKLLTRSFSWIPAGDGTFFGAELNFTRFDVSRGTIIPHFSNPNDIGEGKNMMVLNGKLMPAFTPDSLLCSLKLNNVSLKEVSLQYVSELNNPKTWIWYENKFFIFQRENKVDIGYCSFNNLRNFENSTYISQLIGVPKKIILELIGDIGPLFFSQPEIKPTIILEVLGESTFNKLHIEFINSRGHDEEDIYLKNGSFIFSPKIILNKRHSFLFPFDIPYAEIYNISPGIIQNSFLPVSIKGEDSNLEGTSIFTKNKIQLEFTRKLNYKIEILLYFFLFIVSLILFNNRIKYMRKESFEPKNLLKEWWSFVVTLVTLIAVVTSSFKVVFSLINSLVLCLIIITSIRFYEKRKKVNLTYLNA